MYRKLSSIFKGNRITEMGGVNLTRYIGTPELRNLDPFLMLDYLVADKPKNGFPDHPHRGFEAVTYLIKGKNYHEDNLGNEGTLDQGGIQWMTTGRGIIHSEIPDIELDLQGFQLWVNLPNYQKMIAPCYQEAENSKIPIHKDKNLIVKVLAGKYRDIIGPTQAKIGNVSYYDVKLNKGKSIDINIGNKTNGMIFNFSKGLLEIGDKKLLEGQAGIFADSDEGDTIQVKEGKNDEARFLIFFGKPIGEPIWQKGPFVMGSRDENIKAYEDYKNGTNGFDNSKTWKSKRGGNTKFTLTYKAKVEDVNRH